MCNASGEISIKRRPVYALRPFTTRPFAKEADCMYIQNNIENEQNSGIKVN